MKRDEIFASVAVLLLAGIIVYLTRVGALTIGHLGRKHTKIAANQSIAADEIMAAGGDPGSLIAGPSIYVVNTPWPYGAAVGNVLPPTNAGATLPGAAPADYLGFTGT